MFRPTRAALALLSSFASLACGGAPVEPAGATTSGGEQAPVGAVGAPHAPPPASEEVAAGQATPSPAPAAVALAAVTSHAEPLEDIVDPVEVSPGVYSIVVESTRMRLLVASWKPGQTDAPHGHPPLISYALTDIDGVTTGHSGRQKRVRLRAGAAFYQNPVKAHTFKNVGKQPARMLILELSQRVHPMPMPGGAAPDAIAAAPDVYRRVFEDEHVRVLEANWAPGQMDELHSHPELAAFAVTAIDAKLHDDDGTTRDLKRPAGGGVFQDPVRGHRYENVGDAETKLVLFEPKGGAARASAADPNSFAALPVESGDDEVTTFVDASTGVKMDIGHGFALEIPPGVDFGDVITLDITDARPKSSEVAPGFSRHAQTLVLDGEEESLAKQVILSIAIPRMPEKPGHRFVLAMERSGDCDKLHRKRLRSGGCSHWEFVATQFDETRKKVIAKLGSTGGYRLQFGWLPE